MSRKTKKTFLVVAIILIVILIIELIFIATKTIFKKEKSTYFDSLNAYEKLDEGLIAVGSNNNNDKEFLKAKITKYADNKEKVWEKMYNKGYNSVFYSVKRDGDYYIAVGSYESTKKEHKEKTTTALIVKYDKDGDIVFEKELQILGNSKFMNLVVCDDGYIVVGQSIYENSTLGLADTGGAIIIKYDKQGNPIWQANYGGNKSGIYNSVILSNNFIYTVGKDSSKLGIISKYDLDGNRITTTNYTYTDSLGFSDILDSGTQLIVVGAKEIDDNNTNCLIAKYDYDCDFLDEVVYDNHGKDRFNKIILDSSNYFVTIGSSQIKTKKGYYYNSLIAKYKRTLKDISTVSYGERLNAFLTDIKEVDNKYLFSAYSNYDDGSYMSKFVTYTKALKSVEVK